MRVCPFCSTENEVFFRFCLGCGADLDEALESAGDAGTSSGKTVKSVPSPVAAPPTPATPPSKPVARPVAAPAPAAEKPKSREVARPAPITGSRPRLVPPEEPLPSTMVRHRKAAPKSAPRRREAPVAAAAPGGRLVLILEDGTDGAVYDIPAGTTTLGREGADINFPHDDFLAPRHAELSYNGSSVTIAPLKSTNGVFVQVSHEVELHSGDVFRVGQELVCFELLDDAIGEPKPDPRGDALRLGSPVPEGAWGRLAQLIAPESWGSVYLLGGSDIYLGRERGDITFPGDGFVSGLHAVLMQREDRYYLKDLGSSNGTYYRLRKATPLRRGALVLAGQQLFRIEH